MDELITKIAAQGKDITAKDSDQNSKEFQRRRWNKMLEKYPRLQSKHNENYRFN